MKCWRATLALSYFIAVSIYKVKEFVMYSSQLSNFQILISSLCLVRLVRLHLVGEYVPIFPTGFLGFRIRRLHKLYTLSGIYFHLLL